MIKVPLLVDNLDTPVITQIMIEDEHGTDGLEAFLEWMRGQTYTVVGETKYYYYHDYQRWVRRLPIED